MVKEIKLQNDMVVLVDDEDYEKVNQYHWVVNKNKRSDALNVHNRDKGYLSHFVIGKKEGFVIIHLNGNRFDFRKENLSHVPFTAAINKSKARKGTSKYKGVSWARNSKKWTAYIHVKGKKHHLGMFEIEDEAALAYNEAVDKFLEGFGYKNVIGEDNSRDTEIKFDKAEQKRFKVGSSGYRGVYLEGKGHKYIIAAIGLDRKQIRLGVFSTEEEAAKAYDAKAIELYGDKAILNFPENIEEYKTGGL